MAIVGNCQSNCQSFLILNYLKSLATSGSALDSHPIQRAQALEVRLAKYADYMIFNNVIMLCEGEDSNEAFKLCNDLIDLVSK